MKPYAFRVRRLVPVAALAVLAAACADAPLAPAAPARLSAAAPGDGPPLVPNGRRYREQGYAHATGRSGSAALWVRALLGRDGAAELVATAGRADGEPARGTIARLQVKLLDAAGGERQTLNFNGLDEGATVVRTLPGAARGALLRVQANVRGIDPRRTDVVTATERVGLRPDLAVGAVQAPAAAFVGSPAGIQAVVAELNGDVGATASCVLYVDGAEADRADGVWVAEGDAVTCAFRHTFAAEGTRTVAVAVEGVDPGDWDAGNNRREAEVVVSVPQVRFFGYAYAWENTRASHDSTLWRWRSADGSFSERGTRTDTVHVSEGMTMTGQALRRFAPAAARLEVAVRSGGRTLFSHEGAPSWRSAGPDGECVGHTDGPSTVQVCTRPYGSEVSVARYAGRAVYFSRGASRVYRAWDGFFYHQSWSEQSVAGAASGLDADVSFDVRLDDGLAEYTAAVRVPLAGAPQPFGTPVPVCRAFADPWSSTETCTARWGSNTSRSGWNYF